MSTDSCLSAQSISQIEVNTNATEPKNVSIPFPLLSLISILSCPIAQLSLGHAPQRLAICSGWLLKKSLSTETKRNSEDKTFYLHVTQPLLIAVVASMWRFIRQYSSILQSIKSVRQRVLVNGHITYMQIFFSCAFLSLYFFSLAKCLRTKICPTSSKLFPITYLDFAKNAQKIAVTKCATPINSPVHNKNSSPVFIYLVTDVIPNMVDTMDEPILNKRSLPVAL